MNGCLVTVRCEQPAAAGPLPPRDEVEQIKELIEIQMQIVELARQNEVTRRECEALRHELAEAMCRPRRRPGLVPWWRGWLQRFRGTE